MRMCVFSLDTLRLSFSTENGEKKNTYVYIVA